ncbi:quinone oxidoreductase family protein [Chloracidobacterium validum]|nr:zinc-binding dehydrogenase [Chloracidobacterium validum]
MPTRQAMIVETFGGPEALRLVTEELPNLTPGLARVAIEAIGVNRADILLRAGAYHGARPPARLGLEAAGTVVESCTPDLPVGSRVVIFGNRTGLYATEVVVQPSEVALLPDAVSTVTAAALPVNWLTAWYCLRRLIGLRPDDTLLIPAATSGVGVAAIQIARHVGARIIAAASTPEKLAVAARLGAHVTVNYAEINLLEAVRDITEGKGVTAFLDTVGGLTFADGLKALAPFGRVTALANVTLEPSVINVRDFYPKNAQIYGFQLGNLMAAGRYPEARADLDTILERVADRTFHPIIAGSFPLSDAATAHRQLESRAVIGKLLLVTSGEAENLPPTGSALR